MPAHRVTALAVSTPSSGRNSGMIGVNIEDAMVMTNWMPTIAQSVRCHCAAAPPAPMLALGSASAMSACEDEEPNGRVWSCCRRQCRRRRDKRRVAAVTADDREADRQTVDFGAGDADLRHAGEAAMAAEAQDAVTVRARHRGRLPAARPRNPA